ncbi:hypothetical protein L1987_15977 [Smallanthus sonchifolius]|uniref:Uncharacterized protein n=1 Tax=Smallanthus sonchifolius TaxID=185202 RepID=A0ACB9J7K3_9ASTR|nr:hypothetical protein L1987_15977 [Smallanthus sonchifolius]
MIPGKGSVFSAKPQIPNITVQPPEPNLEDEDAEIKTFFRSAKELLRLPENDQKKMFNLANIYGQQTVEGNYVKLILRDTLYLETVKAIPVEPLSSFDKIISWEFNDKTNLFTVTRMAGGKSYYKQGLSQEYPKKTLNFMLIFV